MRTRSAAAALLLAITPATLTVPISARAQAAADDPTTDMARARFKEGVGFYDKGQFEQARASFLQAYALKKHPTVLLNLAWSCLKGGHALEAQRYFKQFLAEGKDATEKQRADANDGLAQSSAKLGRIEVVAGAPGTEVTVDNERAGTTPLAEPILVEPGAHTVKFKGPDGSTDTDSVTVLAGEKAIARFAKTALVATMPASPPPAATPPPEAEPPPSAISPQSSSESDISGREEPSNIHRRTIFVPRNLAPVLIGVGVAAGSVVWAFAMLSVKTSAQNRANDVADAIKKAGGTSCNPPAPTTLNGIVDACRQFQKNNDDVNVDATLGNVAIGVAAAALVGTGLYWLLAPKRSAGSTAYAPQLVPTVGPKSGALSVTGSF
jgi:hypothetical protein